MIDSLAQILRNAIGLDAHSIGLNSIERAVARRMSARSLTGWAQYLAELQHCPEELHELVESVVVPETWFFRDPEAFTAVVGEALRKPQSRQLRYLCVPSSTGEEPYSLCMALLDAGISPLRFSIDAVDVSARALEKARTAVYGSNSFRSLDCSFRDRHFRQVADGYAISDAVRDQVNFRRGNVLNHFTNPGAEHYDAVFCRNLLIYFDAETKDKTIPILWKLLAADGMLCVAPAETGILRRHRFISARIPGAFAFRKVNGAEDAHHAPKLGIGLKRRTPISSALPSKSAGLSEITRSVRAFRALPVPDPKAGDPVEPAKIEGNALAQPRLEQAQDLADRGAYDEAARLCLQILQSDPGNADAYCLKGLIHDARNEHAEAISAYRKALYLHPRHLDALLHYRGLAEKMGDIALAGQLKQRAWRIKSQNELKGEPQHA